MSCFCNIRSGIQALLDYEHNSNSMVSLDIASSHTLPNFYCVVVCMVFGVLFTAVPRFSGNVSIALSSVAINQ